MPPTTPCGTPCVSVVLARLIVDGEDKGVRSFLVPLHDGETMHPGIITRCALPERTFQSLADVANLNRLLCPRIGSSLNHALTYFCNLRLPPGSLLGPLVQHSNPRATFFHNITRVISGTLCMGSVSHLALRVAVYTVGKYSLRRTVSDPLTRTARVIASFSTQYIPILRALAMVEVFSAFGEESWNTFVGEGVEGTQKHFVAAVYKVTVVKNVLESLLELGDRCGAQGLLECNRLVTAHVRSSAISFL